MTFRTAMIDPPWPEVGGKPKAASWGGRERGADQHYPVLPVAEIPDVVRGSGVFEMAADSHLYLWVTRNFLPDGLVVMEALGFRYVTLLTWVKSGARFGMGRYFRGRHEPLLFGVRGRGLEACTPARNIDDLIIADPTRHSRKPAEAYLKVEQRSRGPFVEIFGRGSVGRPGWTCWGNEAVTGGDAT